MRPDVPALPGVLDADAVRATGAALAALQEPGGALPWSAGDLTDVWNHVEAAMGLLVAGEVAAAERAWDWCWATQRPDGSWPMRLRAGRVVDAAAESNMCGYPAVGVWHHWLVRRDERFVARAWPAVRAALDHVVGLQLPFGGIGWVRGTDGVVAEDALLAGSASLHQALRCGLALADLVGEPQPDWELACGRLGHALRAHRDLFLDKSTFSMDWYYPVLGGAVTGADGRALLASRWDDFVVPGLGVRCVDTNPWVTGAETCELALALDAVGERDAALTLLADVQHLRAADGGYWTGYVYPDDAIWPEEHTGYTSAAVLLAVDALAGGPGDATAGSTGGATGRATGGATGGSGLFRGDGLPAPPPELALECGCIPTPPTPPTPIRLRFMG